MKRIWLLALLLSAFALSGAAKVTTAYQLSFDPAKHFIDVEMTVSGLEGDEALLKMPVWAPGYYLILNSPKHLSGFRTTDAEGNPLKWERVGKTGWKVATGGKPEIKAKYRIFANRQSVGEAQVDEKKAFLPGNEVYLYVDGAKDAPATVTLNLPAEWQTVTTGLRPMGGNTWSAADYDLLVDSPIYIGNQAVKKFALGDRDYEIAVAEPKDLDLDRYAEEMGAIVTAASELMGHVPYDRYAFIWMGRGGGGLEHINSQACFTDEGLYSPERDAHQRWLRFAAHEYYHLYNVKCIRPFELGPFDYDQENYTDQLWVSEGLTCYYEGALLQRAGLCTPQELMDHWGSFIRTLEKTPGREVQPLWASSYDIWLNFFPSDANSNEVLVSYYVKGPVVGAMMDLAIRDATDNRRSLDDLMRLLYNRYYLEQGRGFTTDEFWETATEVAEGNPLQDIRDYVFTLKPIDYDRHLGAAGLRLNRDTWKLDKIEGATPRQLKIRESIFGKE